MRFNQLYDLHLLNPYNAWLSKNSDSKYRRVRSSRDSLFQSQPRVNFGWYQSSMYFRQKGFNEFSSHEHRYLINWDIEIKDGGEYLDYDRRHVVYIHTSLSTCWMPKIEFAIGGNQYSFWPRSNKEITRESIRQMVIEHINNVVYYPENTNYGAIQRLYCIKKTDLVKVLKNQRYKESPASDSDAMNAIKRKYGYFTSEWTEPRDFARTAAKLFKQFGKGKNTEVAKFRFDSDIEFDGDIDELEDVFNEQWTEQSKEHLILI